MNDYRKLSGKRHLLVGYSQAWLGSDHLLIVDSHQYVERYQRFAFADIQSIVVTEGGTYWTAVISGACALAMLGLVRLTWPSDAQYFFGAVALIFLAVAAIDLLRGRRCRCVVQTAVNREPIRAIFRLRTARKLLSTVTPLIESAQGTVPVEELAQAAARAPDSEQQFQDSPAEASSPASLFQLTAAPSISTPPRPPAIPRARGYLPEVLFGLLAFDGLLLWFSLRPNSLLAGEALTTIVTIYFAELLVGLIACIKSLSRFTILSAFILVAFLCVVADLAFLTGPTSWHTFADLIAHAQPGGLDPLYHATYPDISRVLLTVGWRIAVGVIGLAVALAERRRGSQ